MDLYEATGKKYEANIKCALLSQMQISYGLYELV